MIKKVGVFATLFLLSFLLSIAIVDGVNCTDGIQNQDETGIDCGGSCDACASSASTSVTPQQNQSKIQDGFKCLKDKVNGKCSSLSIQEIALTILASQEDITDECTTALKAKEKSDHCWGDNSCTIRDTALAVLALDHVGENTQDAEDWLLSKNKTSTDLIWYLEQDSDEATQCKISYSGSDYTINVADNKKIDSSAGNCLNLAQSSFWLQVSTNCYDKEFQISCDKDFISTLIYRQQNSPVIYPLADTKSSAALGIISLRINAKCFSFSNNCNYEDSAWATLALLKTGHNVEAFLPYIIALADSNKRYLPNAFIYMATEELDFGNQLVQEQKFNNWEAEQTAYNKFYDTALALLALADSSGEQVIKARDWLLFQQDSTGCWKNSNSEMIRDTAIILWALERKSHRINGGGGVTRCTDANFFCISTADCPDSENLDDNYYCSGSGISCCRNEHLQTCAEKQGQKCPSGKVCEALSVRTSDVDNCCLVDCIDVQSNDCESDGGYICKDECSDNQEVTSAYDCYSGKVCCKAKSTLDEPKPSYWWIWLLIILILVVLGVIVFLKREKLKLLWFKMKSKFKKEKGSQSPGWPTGPGGFPPRPGFPPVRRMPPRPMIRKPMSGPVPSTTANSRSTGPKDKRMDDTFEKLKKMSN